MLLIALVVLLIAPLRLPASQKHPVCRAVMQANGHFSPLPAPYTSWKNLEEWHQGCRTTEVTAQISAPARGGRVVRHFSVPSDTPCALDKYAAIAESSIGLAYAPGYYKKQQGHAFIRLGTRIYQINNQHRVERQDDYSGMVTRVIAKENAPRIFELVFFANARLRKALRRYYDARAEERAQVGGRPFAPGFATGGTGALLNKASENGEQIHSKENCYSFALSPLLPHWGRSYQLEEFPKVLGYFADADALKERGIDAKEIASFLLHSQPQTIVVWANGGSHDKERLVGARGLLQAFFVGTGICHHLELSCDKVQWTISPAR